MPCGLSAGGRIQDKFPDGSDELHIRPLNSGEILVDGLKNGGSGVEIVLICGAIVEDEMNSSDLDSGRLEMVGKMSTKPEVGVDDS